MVSRLVDCLIASALATRILRTYAYANSYMSRTYVSNDVIIVSSRARLFRPEFCALNEGFLPSCPLPCAHFTLLTWTLLVASSSSPERFAKATNTLRLHLRLTSPTHPLCFALRRLLLQHFVPTRQFCNSRKPHNSYLTRVESSSRVIAHRIVHHLFPGSHQPQWLIQPSSPSLILSSECSHSYLALEMTPRVPQCRA